MAFRLALALGEPNPYEMLRKMPWRVFREWMEYATIEPFGELRADMRIGYAAAGLAGLWGKPKGARGWKVKDFVPTFEKPMSEQEKAETQVSRIKALTLMLGGTVDDARKS